MKEWFDALGARERLVLGGGTVVLLLFLVYALLWSPLDNGYQAMKSRVVAQRETVAWMEQGARELRQLQQARGPAASGLGGKSLLATADSTARANGLGNSLKRVEPEGSRNVRVWLEGASFDLVMQWLGGLRTTYGISTDSASIERITDTSGRINARLTLQAPGP